MRIRIKSRWTVSRGRPRKLVYVKHSTPQNGTSTIRLSPERTAYVRSLAGSRWHQAFYLSRGAAIGAVVSVPIAVVAVRQIPWITISMLVVTLLALACTWHRHQQLDQQLLEAFNEDWQKYIN